MSRFRFNDLAYDLQKQIIAHVGELHSKAFGPPSFISCIPGFSQPDQIARPTDLKTLCLTSKAFRDLATPRLYCKVTLFIGCSRDVRISGLLSRTNPGLYHIRKLYLQLQKTYTTIDPHDDDNSSSSDEEEHLANNSNLAGPAKQGKRTTIQ